MSGNLMFFENENCYLDDELLIAMLVALHAVMLSAMERRAKDIFLINLNITK
jgi:hypothetical protein